MRTSERTRLIGILIGYAETDPALQSQLAAFRDALTKLGWTDGRNLRIELRWAAGNPDRMKTLAKELVELRNKKGNVRFWPKADIGFCAAHVRF